MSTKIRSRFKTICCSFGPFVLTLAVAAGLLYSLKTGNGKLDAATWPASQPAEGQKEGAGGTPKVETVQPQEAAGDSKMKRLPETATRNIFSMTVYFFIWVNTFIFLVESRNSSKRVDDPKMEWAFWITVVCWGATIAWMFRIYHGWDAPTTLGHYPDEAVAAAFFGAFLIVDWLNFSAYQARCRDPKLCSVEDIEEANFSRSQIFLVDLPVIIGIFVVLAAAYFLSARFTDTHNFVEAFFCGATLMHLTASQMIYALLASMRDFAKRQRALAAQTLSAPPTGN